MLCTGRGSNGCTTPDRQIDRRLDDTDFPAHIGEQMQIPVHYALDTLCFTVSREETGIFSQEAKYARDALGFSGSDSGFATCVSCFILTP